MMDLVLAIDQGTSATKCVLVDARGRIVAKAAVPVGERYPQPGWVEQDAEDIWDSVRAAVAQCLARNDRARVVAVGLSTQRESALIWQRDGTQALTPLLSWQDQRTVALRERIAPGSKHERTLAQEQPNHRAAGRTERDPDRHLALPRRGSCEQEIGDIHATDQ